MGSKHAIHVYMLLKTYCVFLPSMQYSHNHDYHIYDFLRETKQAILAYGHFH